MEPVIGFDSEMERQHTSKILWQDWTDDAFQRAKTERKLVLLDISAVWCHWCHRLDQDTYSVSDIAEYIQNNFIPIRVDTDKRPDINRRYNLGGWPTTAFLTPDGRVIGGGTYFPPEQMRQVLRDIKSAWEKSQSKISSELGVPEPEKTPVGELSGSIVDEIVGEVANNFDPIYGGFGSQPKFPSTEAHELALMKYHYTGNHEFLRIVTVTLNNVGKSGVYDREMGGFFRYSTVRDWSIPHFEKMCEDNAKWLQLYAHAYAATEAEFYAEIVKGIIGYVNTWLSDQELGCFFGSQDADEEYYKLTKDERLKLKPPYVDKHIYTNWNALMISSYLDASLVLGDVTMREFALKSLDRLLELNYKKDEGMFHFYDGEPHLSNQLADQVTSANTLSHAYECTGDEKYVKIAEEIVQLAGNKLYDSEHGGFFDTVADPDAPGFLSRPTKPLDENSTAARALMKLHHLTGKESYRKQAEDTLKRFMEIYPSFGFMSAEYGLAVDVFLNEPTLIQIVGSTDRPETRGLLTEANRVYEPRKIIKILNPNKDAAAISSSGYRVTDQPTAYICVGRTCTAPITEPRQIAPEVQRMVTTQVKT
jgi:hypothetical protein